MKSVLLTALTFAAFLATGPAPASAQIFPLSENTWRNPEFVQRFLGSYGFNTELTPSITSEERTIFETLVPLLQTNPQAAIQQLRAAIKPESSPALTYTLANLHFQTGATAEAERLYRDAIRRFPNFLRAYKNLAILLVQNARYADAVPMLLKTIELGGQGGDVFGLLGFSYLNTQNDVAGLQAYEQALMFEPDSRDWRMGRVQALMNLGRAEEAVGIIDDLVQRFPGQNELLLLQANAFVRLQRPLDAAATLEILRTRSAATSPALVLLGDIYLNFQQPDLALDAYQGALAKRELGPDRLLHIARRFADTRSWGQLDAYLAALDRTALETRPDAQLDLLNLEAASDLAQGRGSAAADKLAQVVARDPLNGRALLLLAEYEWRNDRQEEAEILFERAARVPVVASDALVQHARLLVSRRAYAEAVRLLERAQMLQPRAHIADYLEKVAAAAR